MCVVLDVEYGNSTYRLSSNLRNHRETEFFLENSVSDALG